MTNHKLLINNSRSIAIGWLYPDLMNTYGDRGNIICLSKRLEWRKIKCEIKKMNIGFKLDELEKCDLILMGGAQDKQQTIVNQDLKRIKRTLSGMIEDGIPGLYVCGGFQFLGKYYKEADGTVIEGLDIFDLFTESSGANEKRLIGNIAINALLGKIVDPIVGFENHGGRTYLGKNLKPFGKVLKGHGNNNDGTEGAIYKNSFGTYMHGPILPKNPHFADYLINIAIERKYGPSDLEELDDSLERLAHNSVMGYLGAGANIAR